MTIDAQRLSSLLQSLPAVLQEDRAGAGPSFLGRFLLGFEHLLLGLGDPVQPGLEEAISRLHTYFEPGADLPEYERTPSDFLPWLASWVALTLREDWDELRQRDLIAKAASLYRLRGTRRGVEEFLRIYTRLGVVIDEQRAVMQVGVSSTVGVNALINGGAPHFFKVRVSLPTSDPAQIRVQRAIALSIVDLQKPAHTTYTLDVDSPTFQIGTHSTIGVDTLL